MEKRTKRRFYAEILNDQKTRPTSPNLLSPHQFCLSDLPTAILHEILFKLPINSIMQLKIVSTALYKLVSHPDFTIDYSKNSQFLALFRNVRSELPTFCLLELDSVNGQCIKTIFTPKLPCWPNHILTPYNFIVGTCNGLLCLSANILNTQIVYICNPVTGECITLPKHETNVRENHVVYGFGFCRSTNNYKVLRIIWPWSVKHEVEVSILTVGVDHDRWRSLDPLAYPIIRYLYTNQDLVILNESCHWFGFRGIYTFDFEEEKIGQLSQPDGLERSLLRMRLMTLNDQLCLFDRIGPCEIVIWKMKEYGVVESWTKDMVLDLSVLYEEQLRELSVVRILENGYILFSHPWKEYALSYNPTKRELTDIESNCHGSIGFSPNFCHSRNF